MSCLSRERLLALVVGAFCLCAVASAYGASCGIAHNVDRTVFSLAIVIGFPVAFYLFYLLAATVHELGHLTAAKLIGWDVYMLGIGPLLVRFEPFAVRLGHIFGQEGTGWVTTAPPSPDKQTKWREGILFLAGIAANLVCVAALTIVSVADPHNRLVIGLALVVGSLSLFQAINAAFPAYRHTDGAPLSDGAKFRALFHERRIITQFSVARRKGIALYASGITPEHWDPALIAILEANAEPGDSETSVSELRMTDVFLYERYFALREYKNARAALDRALSRIQPSERIWDGLWIENAFFSALIEGDIPRAEKALAHVVEASTKRQYWYKRALAAIAIARGDRAEALRLLRRGPKRGAGNPFDGQKIRRAHAVILNEARRLPQ